MDLKEHHMEKEPDLGDFYAHFYMEAFSAKDLQQIINTIMCIVYEGR